MAAQTKFLKKLQSKRVLIFGGTSGIGFSVAEGSLEYGATVIVSSSTQSKVDNALERLRAAYPNGNVSGFTADLSDQANLDIVVESSLKKATNDGVDKLDHIVFTSGNFPSKLLTLQDPSLSVEDLQSLGIVRLMAPAIIAKYIPKYTNFTAESSLTITGGIRSQRPKSPTGVFSYLAGAIEALARGLAVDLKPFRVNAVVLGAIDTELLGRYPQEMRDREKENTLVKALGQPEDTAEAYLYLMKDKFVTGSLVVTDGGALLV